MGEGNSGPVAVGNPEEAVREWFDRLGRCVRDVDFEAARALIDPAGVSFGTNNVSGSMLRVSD